MNRRTSRLSHTCLVLSICMLIASRIPGAGAQALPFTDSRETRASMPAITNYKNVRVTQDHNPYSKGGTASAVDPSSGNWIVMTSDFRRYAGRAFFHVSTDNGQTWTDDAVTGGSNPHRASYDGQAAAGVSFDGSGNSYLATWNGNGFYDWFASFLDVDQEIDVVPGFAHGTYAAVESTPVDYISCHVFDPSFTNHCAVTLSQPFITTDANSASPRNGTTYVYYSLSCSDEFPAPVPCPHGTVSVNPGMSAIVESHSTGPGRPFSAPMLVSGPTANAQLSSMVIDASGTPHIFFNDSTHYPRTAIWESTLVGGTWVVSPKPVVSFLYSGLGNPHWPFDGSGSVGPRCAIYRFAAYCTFAANQIESGPIETTPSVYVVALNPRTGAITQIARVNNDPFNDQKHHFFPWAAVTPRQGILYVGWYDDRNDPSNTKVEYFVAKSYDGGKTFPKQQPVSDVGFAPCITGSGCISDRNELVSGFDGIIHAAWGDTRDGVSVQIWSQTIGW